MDSKINIKEVLRLHTLWVENNPEGVRANLYGAILQAADFRWTNLYRAILQAADLRWANLQGADLREANLQGANLQGANLQAAYLREANLQGAYLGNYSIVPETGSFIGYKKLTDNVIAKVQIPDRAKRIGGLTGRKCRAEYVKVLSLTKDGKLVKEGIDQYTGEVMYTKGKVVRPDSFNDDIRLDCTNGIHFFLTEKEAKEY